MNKCSLFSIPTTWCVTQLWLLQEIKMTMQRHIIYIKEKWTMRQFIKYRNVWRYCLRPLHKTKKSMVYHKDIINDNKKSQNQTD